MRRVNEPDDGSLYDRGQVNIPHPRAVSAADFVYDTRRQAWRIWHPSSPEARDPYRALDEPPRLRAAGNLNLIELYEVLRVLWARSQTEHFPNPSKPNILALPYQFLTPQRGWKLRNLTRRTTYTVQAVYQTRDTPPVFAGRVVLEGSGGPEPGDWLEWVDPYGDQDQQPKLAKLVEEDLLGSILEPIPSSGEFASAKKKPFVPLVTYRMVVEEPGSVEGPPFGPKRQLKPQIRDHFSDPEDPRHVIEVHGWLQDLILAFGCHGIGGGVADRLLLSVRSFLDRYTGVLRLLGVSRVLRWRSYSSKRDDRPTYGISTRVVEYLFRMEEQTVLRGPRISGFDIEAKLFDVDTGIVDGETSEPELSRWEATHDSSGNYLYGTADIGDRYGLETS